MTLAVAFGDPACFAPPNEGEVARSNLTSDHFHIDKAERNSKNIVVDED